MRTAYPSLTELESFLFASGLITPPVGSTTRPQDVLDLGAALSAAITEWERSTGWVPFLMQSADTTRTYDPPGPERGPVGIYVGVNNMGGGRKLFLNAGVRTITTLMVGVTLTNPGRELVVNRDYWLRPQNATDYGRPFTYIECTYPQFGNPQSIVITAKFGFGATLVSSAWVPTVPDDAWLAIMKMAVVELIPQLELAVFQGLLKWQDADASETYNQRPYGGLIDSWEGTTERPGQIARVMGRYKRKVTA